MGATAASGTVPITVRLPAALVAKLDALAKATERSRTYWVPGTRFLMVTHHDATYRVIYRVRSQRSSFCGCATHANTGPSGRTSSSSALPAARS